MAIEVVINKLSNPKNQADFVHLVEKKKCSNAIFLFCKFKFNIKTNLLSWKTSIKTESKVILNYKKDTVEK